MTARIRVEASRRTDPIPFAEKQDRTQRGLRIRGFRVHCKRAQRRHLCTAVRFDVGRRPKRGLRTAGERDAGMSGTLTLENVAIDDFAFGVASVSADGFESPVVFPGAAGAFWEH